MIFAQGLPHGNITEPRPFSDPFENEADYAAVTRFFVKETTVLSGKVALVMGSTSGIGLGIARALAADSADTMALKEGVGVRWSKPMPFAISDSS